MTDTLSYHHDACWNQKGKDMRTVMEEKGGGSIFFTFLKTNKKTLNAL